MRVRMPLVSWWIGSGDHQGDHVVNVPFRHASVFVANNCADNELGWYPGLDGNCLRGIVAR